VFFVEEPVFEAEGLPRMDVAHRGNGVVVARPMLPQGVSPDAQTELQRELLESFLAEQGVRRPLLWYYTPMALPFSRKIEPEAVVYDCMDELAAFKGAPPALRLLEGELFRRADVVFTGGHSLYQEKRRQHSNVHPFPSGVDAAHFRRARVPQPDPVDQAAIVGPRAGFFGVVDERLDIGLLRELSRRLPHWHFVIVGPVVKIEPSSLPQARNIHYLGPKPYEELPAYLSGWNVALLPFARNEATRFISPTKTPEYLAAGRPVVSTSIRDVVEPYGQLRLAHIADDADLFARSMEEAMLDGAMPSWLARVDRFLDTVSWDETWQRMNEKLHGAVARRAPSVARSPVLHGVA
jgi:UDP-galactopyranose mutase